MEEFRKQLVLRLRTVLAMTQIWGGMRAPQGTVGDYIMVWRLVGRRVYTHDGQTPLVEERYNIGCYSKKAEDCEELLAAVESAIGTFTGLLGTVEVSNIKLVETIDTDYRDDLGYYVFSADYLVQYYK